MIKENSILVNGKISKESYKTKIGDEITIKIEPPKEAKLKPQDIPLDIIYEDKDIIVINKPKGMCPSGKWKSRRNISKCSIKLLQR